MPPRASLRQRTATPARSTRANNNLPQDTPQDTPTGRRSARAASRAPVGVRDTVSNPALPEIQTQQSYAYGASKAPALPEQLQARDLSMKSVVNRLDNAREAAERNLEARAAEGRATTPDSQLSAREARAQRRASREPSQAAAPPQTQTEAVQRKSRTQAWVESSELEDIREENSDDDSEPDLEQQEREDTVPSSFPSGIIDHSYSYELGRRAPRGLQQHSETRWLSSIQPAFQSLRQNARTASLGVWDWLRRLLLSVQTLVNDLPDSEFIVTMFKCTVVVAFITLIAMTVCSSYSVLCESGSPSIVSQQLSKLCGRCLNPPKAMVFPTATFNISSIDSADPKSLFAALQTTHAHITNLEAQLNDRINERHASFLSEITSLRSQQNALEAQIRRISNRHPATSSYGTSEIASPLLRKINFFSPSNGAIIDPYLTSPTRQKQVSLGARVLFRLLRLNQLKSNPPITALTAWQDEGDCWCAASSGASPQQDTSARLAIHLPRPIYPTELVVEHLPSTSSLSPGTAPRDIELWADFSHISHIDFEKLHIADLIANSDKSFSPTYGSKDRAKEAWARIATAEYISTTPVFSASTGEEIASSANDLYENGLGSGKGHVQRFNLEVNQNGLVHHAQRFVLRVKSNYGGEFTCLYRVRLHGRPLQEIENQN